MRPRRLSLDVSRVGINGGESFQERARVSRVLLLTNQFHDSFECLSLIWYKIIGGQYLSCCFRDPLIRRSFPANSTFRLIDRINAALIIILLCPLQLVQRIDTPYNPPDKSLSRRKVLGRPIALSSRQWFIRWKSATDLLNNRRAASPGCGVYSRAIDMY